MQTERHPASVIPLLRVTKMDRLRAMLEEDPVLPLWELSWARGKPREVEVRCGWPPCTYFYAGQASPSYGDVAFAYASPMEKDQSGQAAPFDTGGVYSGKSYPFKAPHAPTPPDGAIDFLKKNTYPLHAWRVAFEHYLDSYFADNWADYCQRQPPNSYERATWGNPDLPARDKRNFSPVDWCSWVWEVRMETRVPLLGEGLLLWTASQSTMDALLDMDPAGQLGAYPPPNRRGLTNLPHKKSINFARAMKQWTQSWVMEQLK